MASGIVNGCNLPTVVIAILIRNKAHTLPWFFGHIEKLDYPKNRITLWIRSDHNADNTTHIIEEWLRYARTAYQAVDFVADDGDLPRDWNVFTSKNPPQEFGYPDESNVLHWSSQRTENVLSLRQQALECARQIRSDYIFFTDPDNFLLNPRTLQTLMEQERTVIAPMLNSNYASTNVLSSMSEKEDGQTTPDYASRVDGTARGCFQMPLVHSTCLINLKHKESLKLRFTLGHDFDGPRDDVTTFALNSRSAGVPMYMINTDFFGYILSPSSDGDDMYMKNERFIYIKAESWIAGQGPPIEPSVHTSVQFPPSDKMCFDQVYVINLKRRPDRKQRLVSVMQELGLDAKIVEAVDGKKLTDSCVQKLGINQIPDYADRVLNRRLTMGEIGCFLSHYYIWEDIVKNDYETAMVLEDDVKFAFNFRRRLLQIMKELKASGHNWDLIFVGRKPLKKDHELRVSDVTNLVHPDYSYWTVAYILSQNGAKKLLAQKPLGKMFPVDEFIPVMYNKHPREDWKKHFEPRDLIAFSVSPLLAFPTHLDGQDHLVSDTEDSALISETLFNA